VHPAPDCQPSIQRPELGILATRLPVRDLAQDPLQVAVPLAGPPVASLAVRLATNVRSPTSSIAASVASHCPRGCFAKGRAPQMSGAGPLYVRFSSGGMRMLSPETVLLPNAIVSDFPTSMGA